MNEHELRRTVAKVVPTAHLVKMRGEVSDVSPEVDVGTVVQLHGALVVDRNMRRPAKMYLDLEGIGRFVLAQEGSKFVGVTFLPHIYCHHPQPSEAASREE